MRALVLLIVVLAPLSACRAAGEAPAPHLPPGAATVAPPTPIPGASYVYRLDTFQKVYQAFVTGRVPAAIANEVTITVASARIDGFYGSEKLPQNRMLHLSIVGAPRVYYSGADGPDYEWWFVTREETGSSMYPLEIKADAPELRVGLRNVNGAWGLYADTGGGWQPVAGTWAFGELEVSATLRVDEAWPLRAGRYAYMRAVVRHRPPTPEGYDVGGVYPEDLSWRFVSQ